MDTADVEALVEELDSNIDDLEDSLTPLLKTALTATTSKLPLLDKAKLYVLATYAIESILFSALRLNGIDAKSHPVFQELTRVKEYFAKIKTAENAGQKRTTTVDKDAAGRVIRHGLAGNDRYDRQRGERQARERAGVKRKMEDVAVGTHTRFDGAAKRIKAAEQQVPVVRAADVEEEQLTSELSTTGSTLAHRTTTEEEKAARKEAKRQRRLERRLAVDDGQNLCARNNDVTEAEENTEKATTPDLSGSAQSGLKTQDEGLKALKPSPLSSTETVKEKKRKKRKSRAQAAKDVEDARADEMK